MANAPPTGVASPIPPPDKPRAITIAPTYATQVGPGSDSNQAMTRLTQLGPYGRVGDASSVALVVISPSPISRAVRRGSAGSGTGPGAGTGPIRSRGSCRSTTARSAASPGSRARGAARRSFGPAPQRDPSPA